MRIVRYFLLAFWGLLASGYAIAQTGESATVEDAGSAFPFVRIARDPGASAMAGAGMASLEAPAWAAFRNPAAVPLSNMRLLEAAVSFQSWMPGIDPARNIQGGVSIKAGSRAGLSLGFARQGYGSYTVYNDSGYASGTFAPSDMQLALGAGVLLSEQLSIGVQGNWLSSQLDSDTAFRQLSLSLGGCFRSGPLTLAGAFSQIAFGAEDKRGNVFRPAFSLDLGASYLFDFERSRLELNADASVYETGGVSFAAGAHYCLLDRVHARAGYRYSDPLAVLPSHAAVGLGVSLFGARLEGSYLFGSETLGGSWMIGLAYRF